MDESLAIREIKIMQVYRWITVWRKHWKFVSELNFQRRIVQLNDAMLITTPMKGHAFDIPKFWRHLVRSERLKASIYSNQPALRLTDSSNKDVK